MRRFVSLVAILGILALCSLALAAAGGDGGDGGCSISCPIGGSCSASGTPPCTCVCRGWFVFVGPVCSCGNRMMDNPVGG